MRDTSLGGMSLEMSWPRRYPDLSLVRVDLHVHSAASFDCDVPPLEVARRLMAYSIGPVFLTDHDTLDGARQLRDAGIGRTICGEEVTTSEGELIGLFLTRPVPPNLSPEESVRAIKDQGGVVYLQHPFDSRRRSLSEDAVERLRDSIDIVEVFNGRSGAERNRRAEDLCDAIGAVPGAGSDAHTLAELGRVYVELEEFDGPQDFLRKLEAGRIVAHPPAWSMRLRSAWRTVLRG
jgi:predicted metal-dependent phosphoesterase TrpH